MSHPPRVSTRAAWASSLVMAGVLGGVFATVWWVARSVLHRQFDAELLEIGEGFAGQASSLHWDFTQIKILPTAEAHLPHLYLQVHVLRQGRVISSENLGDRHLPFVDPEGDPTRFQTFAGEALKTFLPGIGSLRVVSVSCELPAVGPAIVEVGASEHTLLHALHTLGMVFVVLLPVAVLTSAVVTRIWVERSLKDVDAVAEEAARRDRELLFEPLPVPTGDDAMVRLIQSVNALLARSSTLLHQQEQFSAHSAHELRSPVARVLGHAQVLLQRERSAQEHVEFAKLVEEEMRRLKQVVESLLTLSRLEQTQHAEVFTRTTVAEVCADAIAPLDVQARERHVGIELRLPEDEVPLTADAELLALALGNLVRNALRFAPEGSVVEVEAERAAECVSFQVRDRGPGLPKAVIESGFAPFAHSEGGAGLGLALAAAVARTHGGTLRGRDREGGGALLELEVPVRAEVDTAVPNS